MVAAGTSRVTQLTPAWWLTACMHAPCLLWLAVQYVEVLAREYCHPAVVQGLLAELALWFLIYT